MQLRPRPPECLQLRWPGLFTGRKRRGVWVGRRCDVHLCHRKTGPETRCLHHEADAHTFISPLAYSPSGRFLVVGGYVHETIVAPRAGTWRAARPTGSSACPPPRSRSSLFSRGRWTAKSRYNTGVPANYQRTGTFDGAFSPDGKIVATTIEDKVYLWELATGQLRCRLSFPEGRVRHLAFSPSGFLMVGGYGVGWLLDWHARETKPAGRLSGQELERCW